MNKKCPTQAGSRLHASKIPLRQNNFFLFFFEKSQTWKFHRNYHNKGIFLKRPVPARRDKTSHITCPSISLVKLLLELTVQKCTMPCKSTMYNALSFLTTPTLCEKCPDTEFFLVRIFRHSDWIRRGAEYLSVFIPNTGKYRPEKTPYLDIFHTVRLYCSRNFSLMN